MIIKSRLKVIINKVLVSVVLTAFIMTSIVPVNFAQAQVTPPMALPAVGTLVPLSSAHTPVHLLGLTVSPDNPLAFDFLIHSGDNPPAEQTLKQEADTLIRYFLASLTIPEKDMWVNLSPYEEDRIIEDNFARTAMGRDLLAEDYMLKQLTASLLYPDGDIGKVFWRRVRQKAEALGLKDIPTETFHKIWITPESATVFEDGQTAYVVESKLKVLLEEDYLAYSEQRIANSSAQQSVDNSLNAKRHTLNADLMREVIIPEITHEVNYGAHFARLRQIYGAMVLATWFKQNLKQTLLGQIYADQSKVKGIDTVKEDAHKRIYAQYIDSIKKGAYNLIKEDYDPVAQRIVARKHFSGGFAPDAAAITTVKTESLNAADVTTQKQINDFAFNFDAAVAQKEVFNVQTSLAESKEDPAAMKGVIDSAVMNVQQQDGDYITQLDKTADAAGLSRKIQDLRTMPTATLQAYFSILKSDFMTGRTKYTYRQHSSILSEYWSKLSEHESELSNEKFYLQDRVGRFLDVTKYLEDLDQRGIKKIKLNGVDIFHHLSNLSEPGLNQEKMLEDILQSFAELKMIRPRTDPDQNKISNSIEFKEREIKHIFLASPDVNQFAPQEPLVLSVLLHQDGDFEIVEGFDITNEDSLRIVLEKGQRPSFHYPLPSRLGDSIRISLDPNDENSLVFDRLEAPTELVHFALTADAASLHHSARGRMRLSLDDFSLYTSLLNENLQSKYLWHIIIQLARHDLLTKGFWSNVLDFSESFIAYDGQELFNMLKESFTKKGHLYPQEYLAHAINSLATIKRLAHNHSNTFEFKPGETQNIVMKVIGNDKVEPFVLTARYDRQRQQFAFKRPSSNTEEVVSMNRKQIFEILDFYRIELRPRLSEDGWTAMLEMTNAHTYRELFTYAFTPQYPLVSVPSGLLWDYLTYLGQNKRKLYKTLGIFSVNVLLPVVFEGQKLKDINFDGKNLLSFDVRWPQYQFRPLMDTLKEKQLHDLKRNSNSAVDTYVFSKEVFNKLGIVNRSDDFHAIFDTLNSLRFVNHHQSSKQHALIPVSDKPKNVHIILRENENTQKELMDATVSKLADDLLSLSFNDKSVTDLVIIQDQQIRLTIDNEITLILRQIKGNLQITYITNDQSMRDIFRFTVGFDSASLGKEKDLVGVKGVDEDAENITISQFLENAPNTMVAAFKNGFKNRTDHFGLLKRLNNNEMTAKWILMADKVLRETAGAEITYRDFSLIDFLKQKGFSKLRRNTMFSPDLFITMDGKKYIGVYVGSKGLKSTLGQFSLSSVKRKWYKKILQMDGSGLEGIILLMDTDTPEYPVRELTPINEMKGFYAFPLFEKALIEAHHRKDDLIGFPSLLYAHNFNYAESYLNDLISDVHNSIALISRINYFSPQELADFKKDVAYYEARAQQYLNYAKEGFKEHRKVFDKYIKEYKQRKIPGIYKLEEMIFTRNIDIGNVLVTSLFVLQTAKTLEQLGFDIIEFETNLNRSTKPDIIVAKNGSKYIVEAHWREVSQSKFFERNSRGFKKPSQKRRYRQYVDAHSDFKGVILSSSYRFQTQKSNVIFKHKNDDKRTKRIFIDISDDQDLIARNIEQSFDEESLGYVDHQLLSDQKKDGFSDYASMSVINENFLKANLKPGKRLESFKDRLADYLNEQILFVQSAKSREKIYDQVDLFLSGIDSLIEEYFLDSIDVDEMLSEYGKELMADLMAAGGVKSVQEAAVLLQRLLVVAFEMNHRFLEFKNNNIKDADTAKRYIDQFLNPGILELARRAEQMYKKLKVAYDNFSVMEESYVQRRGSNESFELMIKRFKDAFFSEYGSETMQKAKASFSKGGVLQKLRDFKFSNDKLTQEQLDVLIEYETVVDEIDQTLRPISKYWEILITFYNDFANDVGAQVIPLNEGPSVSVNFNFHNQFSGLSGERTSLNDAAGLSKQAQAMTKLSLGPLERHLEVLEAFEEKGVLTYSLENYMEVITMGVNPNKIGDLLAAPFYQQTDHYWVRNFTQFIYESVGLEERQSDIRFNAKEIFERVKSDRLLDKNMISAILNDLAEFKYIKNPNYADSKKTFADIEFNPGESRQIFLVNPYSLNIYETITISHDKNSGSFAIAPHANYFSDAENGQDVERAILKKRGKISHEYRLLRSQELGYSIRISLNKKNDNALTFGGVHPKNGLLIFSSVFDEASLGQEDEPADPAVLKQKDIMQLAHFDPDLVARIKTNLFQVSEVPVIRDNPAFSVPFSKEDGFFEGINDLKALMYAVQKMKDSLENISPKLNAEGVGQLSPTIASIQNDFDFLVDVQNRLRLHEGVTDTMFVYKEGLQRLMEIVKFDNRGDLYVVYAGLVMTYLQYKYSNKIIYNDFDPTDSFKLKRFFDVYSMADRFDFPATVVQTINGIGSIADKIKVVRALNAWATMRTLAKGEQTPVYFETETGEQIKTVYLKPISFDASERDKLLMMEVKRDQSNVYSVRQKGKENWQVIEQDAPRTFGLMGVHVTFMIQKKVLHIENNSRHIFIASISESINGKTYDDAMLSEYAARKIIFSAKDFLIMNEILNQDYPDLAKRHRSMLFALVHGTPLTDIWLSRPKRFVEPNANFIVEEARVRAAENRPFNISPIGAKIYLGVDDNEKKKINRSLVADVLNTWGTLIRIHTQAAYSIPVFMEEGETRQLYVVNNETKEFIKLQINQMPGYFEVIDISNGKEGYGYWVFPDHDTENGDNKIYFANGKDYIILDEDQFDQLSVINETNADLTAFAVDQASLGKVVRAEEGRYVIQKNGVNVYSDVTERDMIDVFFNNTPDLERPVAEVALYRNSREDYYISWWGGWAINETSVNDQSQWFDWNTDKSLAVRKNKILYKYELESKINKLIEQRSDSREPLYILDWGFGDGTAIDELAQKFEHIENLYFIGYGMTHDSKWSTFGETFKRKNIIIFDHIWKLEKHLKKILKGNKLALVYSHFGLAHLLRDYPDDAREQIKTLMKYMKNGASLITNYYWNDSLPSKFAKGFRKKTISPNTFSAWAIVEIFNEDAASLGQEDESTDAAGLDMLAYIMSRRVFDPDIAKELEILHAQWANIVDQFINTSKYNKKSQRLVGPTGWTMFKRYGFNKNKELYLEYFQRLGDEGVIDSFSIKVTDGRLKYFAPGLHHHSASFFGQEYATDSAPPRSGSFVVRVYEPFSKELEEEIRKIFGEFLAQYGRTTGFENFVKDFDEGVMPTVGSQIKKNPGEAENIKKAYNDVRDILVRKNKDYWQKLPRLMARLQQILISGIYVKEVIHKDEKRFKDAPPARIYAYGDMGFEDPVAFIQHLNKTTPLVAKLLLGETYLDPTSGIDINDPRIAEVVEEQPYSEQGKPIDEANLGKTGESTDAEPESFDEEIKEDKDQAAITAVDVHGTRVPGGGIIWTRMPAQYFKVLRLRRGGKAYLRESSIKGLVLENALERYRHSDTPLQKVNNHLGIDLVDEIVQLDQLRQRENEPNRVITVLDWGGGSMQAIKDILNELKAQNIKNVRLIGSGHSTYLEWKDIPEGIEVIWDVAQKLHLYIAEGSIDIIYSHYGMYHLDEQLPQYLMYLEKLLSPRAKILIYPLDGDLSEQLPGWKLEIKRKHKNISRLDVKTHKKKFWSGLISRMIWPASQRVSVRNFAPFNYSYEFTPPSRISIKSKGSDPLEGLMISSWSDTPKERIILPKRSMSSLRRRVGGRDFASLERKDEAQIDAAGLDFNGKFSMASYGNNETDVMRLNRITKGKRLIERVQPQHFRLNSAGVNIYSSLQDEEIIDILSILDSEKIARIRLNNRNTTTDYHISWEKPWRMNRTPLDAVDMFAGLKFYELESRVETIINNRQDDAEPIYIFDWGFGAGTALKELSEKFDNIPNIFFIGFGDAYYEDWHTLPSNVIIIYDQAWRLEEHLSKILKGHKIDLAFSHWALSSHFLGDYFGPKRVYFLRLMDFLKPGASFVIDALNDSGAELGIRRDFNVQKIPVSNYYFGDIFEVKNEDSRSLGKEVADQTDAAGLGESVQNSVFGGQPEETDAANFNEYLFLSPELTLDYFVALLSNLGDKTVLSLTVYLLAPYIGAAQLTDEFKLTNPLANTLYDVVVAQLKEMFGKDELYPMDMRGYLDQLPLLSNDIGKHVLESLGSVRAMVHESELKHQPPISIGVGQSKKLILAERYYTDQTDMTTMHLLDVTRLSSNQFKLKAEGIDRQIDLKQESLMGLEMNYLDEQGQPFTMSVKMLFSNNGFQIYYTNDNLDFNTMIFALDYELINFVNEVGEPKPFQDNASLDKENEFQTDAAGLGSSDQWSRGQSEKFDAARLDKQQLKKISNKALGNMFWNDFYRALLLLFDKSITFYSQTDKGIKPYVWHKLVEHDPSVNLSLFAKIAVPGLDNVRVIDSKYDYVMSILDSFNPSAESFTKSMESIKEMLEDDNQQLGLAESKPIAHRHLIRRALYYFTREHDEARENEKKLVEVFDYGAKIINEIKRRNNIAQKTLKSHGVIVDASGAAKLNNGDRWAARPAALQKKPETRVVSDQKKGGDALDLSREKSLQMYPRKTLSNFDSIIHVLFEGYTQKFQSGQNPILWKTHARNLLENVSYYVNEHFIYPEVAMDTFVNKNKEFIEKLIDEGNERYLYSAFLIYKGLATMAAKDLRNIADSDRLFAQPRKNQPVRSFRNQAHKLAPLRRELERLQGRYVELREWAEFNLFFNDKFQKESQIVYAFEHHTQNLINVVGEVGYDGALTYGEVDQYAIQLQGDAYILEGVVRVLHDIKLKVERDSASLGEEVEFQADAAGLDLKNLEEISVDEMKKLFNALFSEVFYALFEGTLWSHEYENYNEIVEYDWERHNDLHNVKNIKVNINSAMTLFALRPNSNKEIDMALRSIDRFKNELRLIDYTNRESELDSLLDQMEGYKDFGLSEDEPIEYALLKPRFFYQALRADPNADENRIKMFTKVNNLKSVINEFKRRLEIEKKNLVVTGSESTDAAGLKSIDKQELRNMTDGGVGKTLRDHFNEFSNLFEAQVWSPGLYTLAVRDFSWTEIVEHHRADMLKSIDGIMNGSLKNFENMSQLKNFLWLVYNFMTQINIYRNLASFDELFEEFLEKMKQYSDRGKEFENPTTYDLREVRLIYYVLKEDVNAEENRKKLSDTLENIKIIVEEIEHRIELKYESLKKNGMEADKELDKIFESVEDDLGALTNIKSFELRAPSSEVGGIDLDSKHLDLQIKRDGRGVALPVHMQDIPNIQIDGLYPVIINITPVTTVPLIFSQILGEQGDTDHASVTDYPQLSYAIKE